jgi:hypothetical protein
MASNPPPIPNGSSDTFTLIKSNCPGGTVDNLQSSVCITNIQEVTDTDDTSQDAPTLFNTLTINTSSFSQPFLRKIQQWNTIKLVGYSPNLTIPGPPTPRFTDGFWFNNAPNLPPVDLVANPSDIDRILRVPDNHPFATRDYILLKATLEDAIERPTWIETNPGERIEFANNSTALAGVQANAENTPIFSVAATAKNIFANPTGNSIRAPGGTTVSGGFYIATNRNIIGTAASTGIYGGNSTAGGAEILQHGDKIVWLPQTGGPPPPNGITNNGHMKITLWLYKLPTDQALGQ